MVATRCVKETQVVTTQSNKKIVKCLPNQAGNCIDKTGFSVSSTRETLAGGEILFRTTSVKMLSDQSI